jgi:uncharacterized Zn finger protein
MRDDMNAGQPDTAPTVEVTIYRDGEVIHRELCETDVDAEAVVEQWKEVDGTEFQVDDLAVHHRPTDVLEPTESVLGEHEP